MKKALLIILAGILIMASAIPVCASSLTTPTYTKADAIEWTMGYTQKINAMQKGVQGTNGWYCLYTTETNKNGAFDLNQVQAAKWGRTSNCWKYYGVVYNWSPAEYLVDGYDFSGNGNWWLMDGSGRMDTNVAVAPYTGIYAWAAPYNEVYDISVYYVAGGGNQSYEGVRYYATDGVTLSINTKDGAKKVVDAPATNKDNLNLSQGNMATRIALDAGELVYFCVDPQTAGDYDYAQLKIHISISDEEEEESDGEGTGDGENGGTGDGTEVSDPEGTEESGDDTQDTGTGTGEGTGDGDGSASADESVLGKTDAPAPDTTEEVVEKTEEEIEEDTNKAKELLNENNLFQLSEEAAAKLTLALNGQKQQQKSEETGGTNAEESGGGSLEETQAETDQMKVVIIVIALAEVLATGVVFGAGKYYKNI